MSPPTRTVGVIGGLGPGATLDFFGRIIARTDALRDQDHLRVIIDNNTKIPDRNAASRNEGPSPAEALAATARGLEIAGADFIVMACNSAHAYEAGIRSAISIPFFSMIGETIDVVARLDPKPRRVGVLATDGARAASLYQDALTRIGVEPVLLADEDQREFMSVVYAIKSGDVGASSRERMRALAEKLVGSDADAIIAGCTEIPLVLDAMDIPVPLVSATDILVEKTILFAGADLRA